MPGSGFHHPPAPYCEDCSDDDSQGSNNNFRASANVPVKRKSSEFDSKSVPDGKSHEGSDSGYSSKAGTSDTMSTASTKKPLDLKIDTEPIERKRQPYVFKPTASDGNRSPTKTKEAKMHRTSKPPSPKFRHPYGICVTCDNHGYHFDVEKEIPRPATVAPTQTQKMAKSPAPKARSKDGEGRPATSRRSSSTSKHESRPKTWYLGQDNSPFPVFSPMDFAEPTHAGPGWHTPPPQMNPYPQYQYAYPQTTPTPTYPPTSGPYDVQALQIPYIEPYYENNAYANYKEPAPTSNPTTKKHSELQRTNSELQRTSSREPRPRTTTRSHKAELDRKSMPPPPPRPDHVRPSMRKGSTEYPLSSSRRRSVFIDDDEAQQVQSLIARERTTSQSRPPSSYKAPEGAQIQGRPRARKSASYSTSSGTVHVASQREMHRRSTDPYEQKPYEEKVAAAENFIASKLKEAAEDEENAREFYKQPKKRDVQPEFFTPKASKPVVNPTLTPESLKKLQQQHSSTGSDVDSVRSKQSSSRESFSGRTRAGTTLTGATNTNSIIIDHPSGFSLSIPADGGTPFELVLGGIRFSSNPNHEEEPSREYKRIEKAPSEVSHVSHRSLTNGSTISTSKSREEQQALARQKQSARSSKRSSRAASTNRQNIRSIDYSVIDDSPELYYLD